MEKREPSCTVGGNVNWYSHLENSWRFLRKLKTELPHDPAIPLLATYPEKIIIQKDMCSPVFIAVLYTVQGMEST